MYAWQWRITLITGAIYIYNVVETPRWGVFTEASLHISVGIIVVRVAVAYYAYNRRDLYI